MKLNMTSRSAFGAVRRHPIRTAAICVPLLAASVFAGSTMASATPTPTLAVSSAELNAAPAPDVQITDDQMTGGTAAVVKATPVSIPFNEDGCDHDYGTPNQCVPWTIPGSTSQAKCAWLRSNGFGPLRVVGTNRQNLAEDVQGYVCAAEG